jgi:taurine--2-oxoglutarate transaminase
MVALKRSLQEQGLFATTHWHTLLVIPPLPVTEAQLEEGFAIIDRALEETDQGVKG